MFHPFIYVDSFSKIFIFILSFQRKEYMKKNHINLIIFLSCCLCIIWLSTADISWHECELLIINTDAWLFTKFQSHDITIEECSSHDIMNVHHMALLMFITWHNESSSHDIMNVCHMTLWMFITWHYGCSSHHIVNIHHMTSWMFITWHYGCSSHDIQTCLLLRFCRIYYTFLQ